MFASHNLFKFYDRTDNGVSDNTVS